MFLYILIHRFGISIHSLRMEGDGRSGDIRLMLGISIHSLRMEGDVVVLPIVCANLYFNPLPPHGGRRRRYWHPWKLGGISIHSLRMEGDATIGLPQYSHMNFNPLPPHGGRLLPSVVRISGSGFQSTPSAWRETSFCSRSSTHLFHFNPLPPHGGRRT